MRVVFFFSFFYFFKFLFSCILGGIFVVVDIIDKNLDAVFSSSFPSSPSFCFCFFDAIIRQVQIVYLSEPPCRPIFRPYFHFLRPIIVSVLDCKLETFVAR